jgi:mercuric ion binding protein
MTARLLAALLCVAPFAPAFAEGPPSAPATAPAPAGERITVGVRGMVCSFCAQGLDKIFKDEPGVAKVDVSLDLEQMVIQLKPGATLEDARLRKLVGDAGFDVLTIDRARPSK